MKNNPNRGGRRAGAGRPKLVDTATLTLRVSVGHKEKFRAQVPVHERRAWLEGRIEAIETVTRP